MPEAAIVSINRASSRLGAQPTTSLAAIPWLVVAFYRREDWAALFSGARSLGSNPLARRLLVRVAIVAGGMIVAPILFDATVQEKTALEETTVGSVAGATLPTETPPG